MYTICSKAKYTSPSNQSVFTSVPSVEWPTLEFWLRRHDVHDYPLWMIYSSLSVLLPWVHPHDGTSTACYYYKVIHLLLPMDCSLPKGRSHLSFTCEFPEPTRGQEDSRCSRSRVPIRSLIHCGCPCCLTQISCVPREERALQKPCPESSLVYWSEQRPWLCSQARNCLLSHAHPAMAWVLVQGWRRPNSPAVSWEISAVVFNSWPQLSLGNLWIWLNPLEMRLWRHIPLERRDFPLGVCIQSKVRWWVLSCSPAYQANLRSFSGQRYNGLWKCNLSPWRRQTVWNKVLRQRNRKGNKLLIFHMRE